MSKATITPEVIKHIANLAMISLTDEEIAKYQKQISDILGYVEKLQEVKTEDIGYQSHVELKNVMRPDEPETSLTQEAATQNRKEDAKQGYFTINMVLPADESA